jgi:hypothetical protein
MVRTAATILALVAMSAAARADSPKLAEARAAIQAVQYDDAQALLVGALEAGGNSPAAVTEIYRLSASVAAVLGQRQVAEQYYRRWLALDASASLPTNLAPKLREPFIAAQAYMNAHGRLSAKATRLGASSIEVVIEADPLTMVVSAALDSGASLAPSPITANHRVTLTAPPASTIDRAIVLDEFGNRLAEISIAPTSTPPATTSPATPAPHAPSRLRSWKLWSVPSVLLLGSGLYFGSRARAAQSELQAMQGSTGGYFFGDYVDARNRRDRNSLVANTMFVGAAACASAAILMFATRPRAEPRIVTPVVSPGSAAVTISGTF